MADLSLSYPDILDLEGRVWSNTPHDNGGETYCGISRVYWPTHPLWQRVDAVKNALLNISPSSLSACLAEDDELSRLVARFYYEWWDRMRLNKITSQRTAFFIFQAAVNIGEGIVSRWVQTACVANGRSLTVDGVIGIKTIAAVNTIPPADMIHDLAVFQRHHYLMCIIKDPGQIVNKAGWERRVVRAMG